MKNSVSPEIKLRPIQMSDAEILMELNNNNEIAKNLVGNHSVVTIEQQLKWMENLINETDTMRWIIDFENEAVGTVFLRSIDKNNGTGNCNIKLLPNAQGKGIGKKAVEEVCKIAFEKLDLFCVFANVLSFNIASRKMFLSAGFQEDGRLRSRVVKDNQRCDLISFSLLRTDGTKKDE